MSELRGALRALDGVRTPVGPDAFAEEGGILPASLVRFGVCYQAFTVLLWRSLFRHFNLVLPCDRLPQSPNLRSQLDAHFCVRAAARILSS